MTKNKIFYLGLIFIIGICSLIFRVNLSQALSNEGAQLKSIEQCANINDFDKKLNCLKKIITSKKENKKEKESALSLIMSYWQSKDGESGYLISDLFLDILTTDYKFFFLQMKKYPKEYDNWIKELNELSFVWFKEPPSPLEKKREKLIAFLKSISDLQDDTDSLRLKLLDALIKIKPRQVD